MHRSLALTAVAVTACSLSAAEGSFLGDWNLVVANDLTLSTSEVDGSALIGGDLLGGTSNYAVQGVSAPNLTGLGVGGTVAPGVTIQVNNGGDFRIGNLANQFGTVNVNGGSTIQDATITSQVAGVMSEADALSAFFAAVPATGTVDGGGNLSSPATTSIDGQIVAVYDITQSLWDSGIGQLNLNFGSADTVVINYSTGGTGMADLTSPPNIIGGFNQANSARILWNFVDATEITINNSFNGAILAPNAALTLNGGGINGSVVVDSIDLQSAEIRLNLYAGATPAPGASALLLCGTLCITRRRRR